MLVPDEMSAHKRVLAALAASYTKIALETHLVRPKTFALLY